jgi:hypothetical protein
MTASPKMEGLVAKPDVPAPDRALSRAMGPLQAIFDAYAVSMAAAASLAGAGSAPVPPWIRQRRLETYLLEHDLDGLVALDQMPWPDDDALRYAIGMAVRGVSMVSDGDELPGEPTRQSRVRDIFARLERESPSVALAIDLRLLGSSQVEFSGLDTNLVLRLFERLEVKFLRGLDDVIVRRALIDDPSLVAVTPLHLVLKSVSAAHHVLLGGQIFCAAGLARSVPNVIWRQASGATAAEPDRGPVPTEVPVDLLSYLHEAGRARDLYAAAHALDLTQPAAGEACRAVLERIQQEGVRSRPSRRTLGFVARLLRCGIMPDERREREALGRLLQMTRPFHGVFETWGTRKTGESIEGEGLNDRAVQGMTKMSNLALAILPPAAKDAGGYTPGVTFGFEPDYLPEQDHGHAAAVVRVAVQALFVPASSPAIAQVAMLLDAPDVIQAVVDAGGDPWAPGAARGAPSMHDQVLAGDSPRAQRFLASLALKLKLAATRDRARASGAAGRLR